jgi:maleylacetate reductase
MCAKETDSPHVNDMSLPMTIGDQSFLYNALPTRVIFGFGTRTRTGDEIRRLGSKRPLVLSTPGHRTEAEALGAQLGMDFAGVFADATMHTPIEVTERGIAAVLETRADGLIALGGGSTTGLAKAIALRTDLPQVILPTTYAGSEMTNILGETSEGKKTTLRSSKVQPECVIYDVDLTFTLPPRASATSGMNAIAHAVEGLYAEDNNPVVSLLALEAVRSLAEGLPAAVNLPQDRAARAQVLYGAWLCGTVLGSVGMALHHKLCHVLGGSFGLPHADVHTVILPHAVSFNACAVPEKLAPVAEILRSPGRPGQGLYDLAKRMGAPLALKDIGMPREGLDRAAGLATESPYHNPRQPTRTEIRALLEQAFNGCRPDV